MSNLINKNVRAFVLSVEKVPRNSKLLEDLSSLGIASQVVTGATPDLAFEYSQKDEFKDRYRAVMSKQQMACTFGHRLMFIEALNHKESHFLFLEDDAVLDMQILADFLNKITRAPRGLILLGACGGFARRHLSIDEFQILRTIGDTVAGSHAYLLDKKSIPDLLNGTEGCGFLADSFSRKVTSQYVLLPYCATQMKDSFTYIPLRSSGQEFSWIRNLLAPLKMDLIDYWHTGIFGGRFMRLPMVEKYFEKIFIKLPGCTPD